MATVDNLFQLLRRLDQVWLGGQIMSAGNWTGWTDDVLDVLRFAGMKQGDVFSLSRIYEAEVILKKLHPNNNHIKAKIRQQLQILQEFGYLEFIDNKGHYRVTKSLTNSK